jgi:hypothetical protein
MQRVFKSTMLALVVGSLAGSVYVFAQPAPSPGDAKDADDGDDATPPARYPEEAEAALGRMRAAMQKGLDEVKEARAEKDNVRLLCVNEPVTAMKGVLRIAENANVDLQEAVATSETAQARREFRKIKQGRRQMDNLLSAAQNCSGVSSTESTTSVEVEIDDNLLALDPYYGDDSFFYDPADDLVDGSTGALGERDPPTVRPPNASGII